MQHTYITNDIHPYSPQDYDAPLQHTSLPGFSDANYFGKPQGPYDETPRIPSYNTPLFAPSQETDLTTGPKFYFQQTDVSRSYATNEQPTRPFEPDNPTDPQLAQAPTTTKQKQKYKCSVKEGCAKTFDFLSLLRYTPILVYFLRDCLLLALDSPDCNGYSELWNLWDWSFLHYVDSWSHWIFEMIELWNFWRLASFQLVIRTRAWICGRTYQASTMGVTLASVSPVSAIWMLDTRRFRAL